MNTAQKKRVTRGAKLLDKMRPGWFRRVKITKLQMALPVLNRAGCGCVLAQEFASYASGLRQLGLEMHYDDTAYGFNFGAGDRPATGGETLTAAWKDQIRKRRAA